MAATGTSALPSAPGFARTTCDGLSIRTIDKIRIELKTIWNARMLNQGCVVMNVAASHTPSAPVPPVQRSVRISCEPRHYRCHALYVAGSTTQKKPVATATVATTSGPAHID